MIVTEIENDISQNSNEEEIVLNTEFIRECGLMKTYTALLTPEIYATILKLLDEYPNSEWLMYLYGKVDDTLHIIEINNYYIPEQEVTSTSVDVTDENIPLTIGDDTLLGSIHSHNRMDAFFSSVDDEHFNYQMMLVVNNSLNFVGGIKITLPCGHLGIAKVDVGIAIDVDTTHIKPKTIVTTPKFEYDYNKYGYGYGYGANETVVTEVINGKVRTKKSKKKKKKKNKPKDEPLETIFTEEEEEFIKRYGGY